MDLGILFEGAVWLFVGVYAGSQELTKIMFLGYGCCSRKSLACAVLLLCTAWVPLGKGWGKLICFSFCFLHPW